MHGQGSFFKKPIDNASPLRPFSPQTLSLKTNGVQLNNGEFPALQYAIFSGFPKFFHATFTRHGGQSSPPYESLNISPHVGDRDEDVAANLGLVKRAAGASHLLFTRQVHGCDFIVAGKDFPFEQKKPLKGDAIITNRPGVAIMVMQADCQGVILYDPQNKVAATVHCGWKGQTLNILSRVVHAMGAVFGTIPDDIRAAIGPSLGPCCAEFKGYRDLFPTSFQEFRIGENHFDLWAISVRQLQICGLKKQNIQVAGICTRCATDSFFSYRGEGLTGRFGTVAMLAETLPLLQEFQRE